MTDWPGDKVRETFVDYFCKKAQHTFIPSSPVVPYDDPTLLFTNAGMNQFKPIFLGQVDPKSPAAKWTRAANSQKCIRAGGKHNDLDDVGKDTYHHTFFEMLGNWSFGEYFKEEAIAWAWDLLVNVYGLNPKRMYVTYFGGDEADGLPADEEAKQIWTKYLPQNRIMPFGRKQNFWEMGDTGPCGPCSEIHYDRRDNREDASMWVNEDSPEVIEIWNLVFMAFNREQSGKLTSLPAKHVDTGMGFERITSILQDKPSNYDTDVFTPIFDKIQEVTQAPKYTGRVGADDVDNRDTAYRIVADHIRTLTFAITDGAVPSAEGRGYVLRRIIRRAIRYGKEFLSAKDGFFSPLVDVVVAHLGSFFTELRKDPERVKQIIKKEEDQFTTTLQRGINKFKSLTRDFKEGDTLSALDTFLLYGTFGFPLDLTQIMCDEKKFKVDISGFNKLLSEQREISQKVYASKHGSTSFQLQAAALSRLQELSVPLTEDDFKYSLSEGPQAVVKAIWQGNSEDGSFVKSVSSGVCGVILDKSNFYAESGGQIYDTGLLLNDDLQFLVNEVKVYGGYVAHIGIVKKGAVGVGQKVQCSVNFERRRPIMANHTATHLTNLALRKILLNDVDQRGSIVSGEKFRFDFTCGEALTQVQIGNVEGVVNDLIKEELPVFTKEVALNEAKKIHGVRAIFSESYPDPVRVVCVGVEIEKLLEDPTNNQWSSYSVEFCGGTHLTNTSEAQTFSIISEEPVSLGERRIVAVTGQAASNAREQATRLENALALLLSTPNESLNDGLVKFKDDFVETVIPMTNRISIREKLKELEQRLKDVAKQQFNEKKEGGEQLVQQILAEVKESTNSFIVKEVAVGGSNKVLNDVVVSVITLCREQLCRDIAVLLLSADSVKGNVVVVTNVPESLIGKGLKANNWADAVASVLGGKGGGKPKGDVGQGNGKKLDKIKDALSRGNEYARSFLG
eukprot:TRINITY_DN1038_c0_g1_i18.p1 TRINITY_DN1038_c0_g1~~TRINITY_DN1038_c0_g1_i18.p1  ORF type:complete len:987 (-),score=239.47 TRINITY_DN1038_c0_g1_i18:206-3085(-)